MVVDERNKTLFVCVYQMPVMLIRIHEIIIMIYMILWGYHIRNNQTKKNGSGTFAVCKNHGTRQIFELCRVPCLQGTRQRSGHVIVPGWLLYFAVGREWHTAKAGFADPWLPCALCRVRHTANGLPWAFGALPCAPGTRQGGGSPVVNFNDETFIFVIILNCLL